MYREILLYKRKHIDNKKNYKFTNREIKYVRHVKCCRIRIMGNLKTKSQTFCLLKRLALIILPLLSFRPFCLFWFGKGASY